MGGFRKEKAYEKYAWLIIFVFGLLWVVASPIQLSGAPPDPPSSEVTTGLKLDQLASKVPGIMNYIAGIDRQMGNFMLTMGVLIMGIAAVPYRKGEKWAWYISWILPVVLVIQLANSFLSTPGGGLGWQLDFSVIFVLLAGLFLPYRKFFPKMQPR